MTMNAGITNVVRPQTLDEVVGNEANKRIIRYAINGARLRNEPFPSFTCFGGAGLGKTTIAEIISRETGGVIHKIMGSDLTKLEDLYLLIAECRDSDVIFIEEAHLLSMGKHGKIISNHLLMLIEDFALPGAAAWGIAKVPKVSFVFSTTEAGKLSSPLRSRCKRLDVNYYNENELVQIILNAAVKIGHDFSTDMEAVRILAQSSRGMPRIAIMHRLDPLLNVMAVDNLPFSVATVRHYLQVMGINAFGFEANDIKYCEILRDSFNETGNPVSFKTIQQKMGCSDNLIQEVIESYLFAQNFVTVSTRGRLLTAKAYKALGWDSSDEVESEPVEAPEEPVPSLSIVFDPAAIKTAIENGADSLGIVKLMKSFGGRYHNKIERVQFLNALSAAGFNCTRGRGRGVVPKGS